MSDAPTRRPAGKGGGGGAPIRVIHVLDNLNTGGTELNAVRTAERLDRDRFDVQFVCLQAEGPLRARLDAARIPVHAMPVSSLVSLSAARRGWELAALVRSIRADVVHAHDPYANVLAAPWVRVATRAAVIASHRWWRNVHRTPVRVANRLAYRFAHRVLANSPSVGELVVSEEGVPRRRLVVIPNFVDDAAFAALEPGRREALRQRVGLGPEHVAIGMVANLYPVKDQAMLIRAASRLAPSWPAVRFVLVGEGEERESLTTLARDLGVADRVLLPGRLPHEPGLAGIFDVAVLTSREEGFPNWVVESMAAGVPVVATRVGGVPDAVAEGESGSLVPAGDDEAMAGVLRGLLEDAALRHRMGAAGTTLARSRYHVSHVMRELQSLYEILARAPVV